MWMRLAFVKVLPGKTDELRKVYYEEIESGVKSQRGNLDTFLLESTDAEDEIISLTSWESKEDAEAYGSSASYAEMVNKVKHVFGGPPTIKLYEIKK